MELKRLIQKWSDVKAENAIHRISLPLMAVALIVMSFIALTNKPIIVMTPPEITEKIEVGANHAGENYKRLTALNLITLLGNVHAGTADFLITTSEELLHPNIYREVKSMIEEEVNNIKTNDLSISYATKTIDYWPDTDVVVVSGTRRTTGRGEESFSETITYEMKVAVQNYRPQITELTSYSGGPKRAK